MYIDMCGKKVDRATELQVVPTHTHTLLSISTSRIFDVDL